MAVANTWEWFVEAFHGMSRIDLKAYKRPQMERRINSFMRTVEAADYASFLNMLRSDHALYRKFVEHLTINVSEFFRNKAQWDTLETKIVPELLKSKRQLKVWSAGCSTGEEPYSLAIMFKERFPGRCEIILATDIDIEALEKAQMGLYTSKAVAGVEPGVLAHCFELEGPYYRVKNDVKQMVTFKQHDLLKDPFPKDIDLLLCRNVVIYFTEETKDKLYRQFTASLCPGGVLFVGSTEQIFQARELGLKPVATFFYQKM